MARALQGLIEQHARRGNPGQFKLIRTAAGLAIVPVATRDGAGAMAPYQSPLDARISFPEAERNGYDAVRLFCDLTGQASGVKIGIWDAAATRSQTVRIGANNEIARDVLARMITSFHWLSGALEGQFKMSWFLMYGGGFGDFLSLQQVTMDQTGPGGRIIRRAVRR